MGGGLRYGLSVPKSRSERGKAYSQHYCNTPRSNMWRTPTITYPLDTTAHDTEYTSIALLPRMVRLCNYSVRSRASKSVTWDWRGEVALCMNLVVSQADGYCDRLMGLPFATRL